MPFLCADNSHPAASQTENGNLLSSKTLPTVTLKSFRHSLLLHLNFFPFKILYGLCAPQCGHVTSLPHRSSSIYFWQTSSLVSLLMKSFRLFASYSCSSCVILFLPNLLASKKCGL